MNEAEFEKLLHAERIKQLKARYFRFVDCKQWHDLRSVFTGDCMFYFESPTPTLVSADAFIAHVSRQLVTAVSVHHGHMPEIDIIDDYNASGIWAMCDWVDDPEHARAFRGYGHYRERYRRELGGEWLISELRLERIRVDEVEPTHREISRSTPASR